MDIKSKNLNLLLVFEALYLDRNVTKAAKRLGLSQPALSHALGRLRDDFDDELFVRSRKGVTPTPKASQQIAGVARILQQTRALYSDSEFALENVIGRFTIATTDYEEHLLMPEFLPALAKAAPGIQVVVRPTVGLLPKVELEVGTIDLAIAGFFGELPEGFYQTTLFKDSYLCLVRKNHPQVGKSLSLTTYAALEHVLASPQGDLLGAVDQALTKKGLKRKVVAGLGNFHTPAAVVANSDLIATIPRRLAESYAQLYDLRTFPVPLSLEGFTVKAVWHARTHQSPTHLWLRQKIQAIHSSK